MTHLLKRLPSIWKLRNRVRSRFFGTLRHVSSLDDSRAILTDMLNERGGPPRQPELRWMRGGGELPYPELRQRRGSQMTRLRSDLIFATGRFRSGSTLLWNIFRNLPNTCSYYEPFNERRWFDPKARGDTVDDTHLGVADYWAEYDGLEELGQYYSEEWTRRGLYMGANSWNPLMQRYIEVMAERARGLPVFQFNRVDLRLPWLRARFPNARIVHIFRNPRDQWCSTLGKDSEVRMVDLRLGQFEPHDRFYLLNWGRDLRHYFPFLSFDDAAHPYELFYQIWRLSYLYGAAYADFSIAYENILATPEASIRRLLAAVSIQDCDVAKLSGLVRTVPLGRWRQLANARIFEDIEARVNTQIDDYFGSHRAAVEEASPTLMRTSG